MGNGLGASSKTERLVFITAGIIILLISMGIIVKVVFDVDVATLIGAGLAALGFNTTGGIARNIITDGPVRQTIAQSQYPSTPPPPMSPPNSRGGQ